MPKGELPLDRNAGIFNNSNQNSQDRLGWTASVESRAGMSEAAEMFKRSMEESVKNMDRQNEFFSADGNVPSNVSMPSMLKPPPEEKSETLTTDQHILSGEQKDLFREKRTYQDYYVVIDSKDRETDNYASPNGYVIHLGQPHLKGTEVRPGFIGRGFNNIVSVELLECILRNTSAESDASDNSNPPPYILLEIEELGGNVEGTNQYLSRSFAVLTNYTLLGNYKYYNFMGNRTNNNRAIRIFKPRISLSKITVKFRLPNGDLYNFGSAYDSSTDTVNQLSFKISVLQRSLITSHLDKSDG